jgi:hypothetical protein
MYTICTSDDQNIVDDWQQQYTVVYLKIKKLSTKRSFIEIYKYHVIEH